MLKKYENDILFILKGFIFGMVGAGIAIVIRHFANFTSPDVIDLIELRLVPVEPVTELIIYFMISGGIVTIIFAKWLASIMNFINRLGKKYTKVEISSSWQFITIGFSWWLLLMLFIKRYVLVIVIIITILSQTTPDLITRLSNE